MINIHALKLIFNSKIDLLKPDKLPFSKNLIEDGGLFKRNKDKDGRQFRKKQLKFYLNQALYLID
jgi:hypothetical protein